MQVETGLGFAFAFVSHVGVYHMRGTLLRSILVGNPTIWGLYFRVPDFRKPPPPFVQFFGCFLMFKQQRLVAGSAPAQPGISMNDAMFVKVPARAFLLMEMRRT